MSDELAQIDGIEPNVLLSIDEETEVKSATSKSTYKVKRKEDHYYCNCPAWRNQSGVQTNARTCKHLRSLLGNEYEDARLKMMGVEVPVKKGAAKKAPATKKAPAAKKAPASKVTKSEAPNSKAKAPASKIKAPASKAKAPVKATGKRKKPSDDEEDKDVDMEGENDEEEVKEEKDDNPLPLKRTRATRSQNGDNVGGLFAIPPATKKQEPEEMDVDGEDLIEEEVGVGGSSEELAQINSLKPKVWLKLEVEEIVGSKTSKAKYKVKRMTDHYYCSCPAWRNQSGLKPVVRTCKHLKELLGEEYELARVARKAADGEAAATTSKAKKAPASKAKAAPESKAKPASKAKAAPKAKAAAKGKGVGTSKRSSEDEEEEALEDEQDDDVDDGEEDELWNINGCKPNIKLREGQTKKVSSQSSKSVYDIKRTFDHYHCSCPAWRNQSIQVFMRTCKHLKSALGEKYEAARIAWKEEQEVSKGKGKGKAAPAPVLKAKAAPKKRKRGSEDDDDDDEDGYDNDKEDGIKKLNPSSLHTLGEKYEAAHLARKDEPKTFEYIFVSESGRSPPVLNVPASDPKDRRSYKRAPPSEWRVPLEPGDPGYKSPEERQEGGEALDGDPEEEQADDDDELAVIDGIKPKFVMKDGEETEVSSKSSSSKYKVKRTFDHYYCTCPAWRMNKSPISARTCKHLKELLGEEYENARCSRADPEGYEVAPSKKKAKTKATKVETPDLLLANKWNLETGMDPKGWWMSEKLDGVRTFYDGEKMISRLGNPFTPPQWFLDKLPADVALDGELFGGRRQFQSTVSIVKTRNSSHWKNITFQIFDIPSHGSKPFEERLSIIKQLFGEGGSYACEGIVVVEQEMVRDREHVLEKLKEIETLGGEGLMLRMPKSTYEGTRSNTLLKAKTFYDAEAIITGYADGKGKYKGLTGALQCRMASGKTFSVGTGLSDKQRRNPPKVGLIIVYRFQELTKDGVPRFPSFVGEAVDKTEPKDAEVPEHRKT